jgi:hypothetical protein
MRWAPYIARIGARGIHGYKTFIQELEGMMPFGDISVDGNLGG